MKEIARHNDVNIYAPDNSRFSFMKSPYAAHKTNSAVDIYSGCFGGEALPEKYGDRPLDPGDKIHIRLGILS